MITNSKIPMAKKKSRPNRRRRAARRRRVMDWAYHGWEKRAGHTLIWCVGDDGYGLATMKVDHDTRHAYALVNGTWVDREATLESELPWEQDGLPDTCVFHVPLVRDNETRRLARAALVAVVSTVRVNPDDKLHGLARLLQSACACTYSLEDDFRRASFLGACHKHGYHEIRIAEWDAFGQHMFDASMKWLGDDRNF